MLKVLLAFFLICASKVYAQYGTLDAKISRNIDPEVFWFRKDSLNLVDTTKSGINLSEFYSMQYSVEMGLFLFDRKKEHLINCVAWNNRQYAQNSTDREALFHGLEISRKLNDKLSLQKYYDLILEKTSEKEWSTIEKRELDEAKSRLSPTAIPYDGPIDDGDFIAEISCTIDTLAEIHSNSEIYFDADKPIVHELVSGSSNYLKLKINTRDCRCRDCSYCSTIYIQLLDGKLPASIILDSTNCFYSTVNTWIYEPKQIISFGKVYRNDAGLYLIMAYKNNPTDDLYLLETYWIAPEKLKGF